MARPTLKEDTKLVQNFLKSVGVELGFYNAATKTFLPDLVTQPLYQTNLEIVRTQLQKGWTERELEQLIFEAYKNGRRAALLSDILPERTPQQERGPETDLLETAETRFHPALWNVTAPVRGLTTDGTLATYSHGQKTLRARYTLGELTERYFKLIHAPFSIRAHAATLGALRVLVEEHGLDTVLFALDEAARAPEPIEPFELRRFVKQAREEVEFRKRGA